MELFKEGGSEEDLFEYMLPEALGRNEGGREGGREPSTASARGLPVFKVKQSV